MRAVVLAALLAALAGAVGGWAGIQYGLRQANYAQDLHEILHHQLGHTLEQEKRIQTLEAQFAERRRSLDMEMRAANRDLADALQADPTYGLPAKQAIERFHQAMAALQEQTTIHILAMREVLTPEQAERFDRTVREALTSEYP